MLRTRAPIEFKVIRIPGRKDDEMTKEAIMSSLNAEIGITPVSYEEFKSKTTQSNVKRYIMTVRGEFRQYLKDMQGSLQNGKKYEVHQNLNKGQFKPHKMPKSRTPDEDPARADRRYGVIDIHNIDIKYDQDGKDPSRKKTILESLEDHAEEYSGRQMETDMNKRIIHDRSLVVNVCLNPTIPIISFELLDAMASRISRIADAEVLALEMVPSGKKKAFWERYASYKRGNAIEKILAPAGQHIFTKYRERTGIEIRKVLAAMDGNVDTLMAPYDLVDLQEWSKEFALSKQFMEKSGIDKSEKSEYARLTEDIKELDAEIKKTRDLLYKDANITTSYFKVNDPRKLSRFKWRNLRKGDESKLN